MFTTQRNHGGGEVLAQAGDPPLSLQRQQITDWPDGTNTYCAHVGKEDYIGYLLLEEPTVYRNFFDWMWKTSTKKLLQSYDEYWRRLCQYFGPVARRPVNNLVHEQMVERVTSIRIA